MKLHCTTSSSDDTASIEYPCIQYSGEISGIVIVATNFASVNNSIRFINFAVDGRS